MTAPRTFEKNNGELRCAVCGHIGYDVGSSIVEVEPQRNVTVYATDVPVPERFRVESRCIDHEACEERAYAALRVTGL